MSQYLNFQARINLRTVVTGKGGGGIYFEKHLGIVYEVILYNKRICIVYLKVYKLEQI